MRRLLHSRQIALAVVSTVATLATPVRADGQRPALPRARAEECDGYCHKVWATCARVQLRLEPSQSAPVIAVIDSGVRMSVLGKQVRTVEPGIVVVRRAHTVTRNTSGDASRPTTSKRWNLAAGDTIYVVDRLGDGDSYADYVWVYKGREATTAEFWPKRRRRASPVDKAQLVAEMVQEYWAQLRGPRGELGWAMHNRSDAEWTELAAAWTHTSYYDDPLEKCAK